MKLNKEIFIERSVEKHGNKYDYSKVVYKTNRSQVEIICNTHGSFFQRADVHMDRSSGCKLCSDDSKRGNIDDFIKISNKLHKFKYNYSKSTYTSFNKDLIILCEKHGEFKQTPHNHLSGQGCPFCNGGVSYSNMDFINISKKIHNDLYLYDKCVYIKSNIEVIISCKKHGDFKQRPDNHINKKYGCPKCGDRYGKMENSWLDYINVPIEYRQKKIKISNRYFKLDALDENQKIIYEFYGDFWHGNPEIYNKSDVNKASGLKFGELYKKTINRENYLKSMGYDVVSIWESDFNKINKIK